MATVKELRAQAKARKIPRYYSLSKSQLMYSLGINGKSAQRLGDARARSTAKKHGIARSFAAEKIGEKLGDGDETKKAAIKKRIVKSVSKELKAHAKKIGRELTIEEKRTVAVKALASEVRAIRSGVPEQKQRRKPVAERKAAQKQRHDAIDKDLSVKRQKVHEKAVASGKSEAEAAQVAYQTVKPRSIVREALAKKQAAMERSEKNEPKNESKKAEAKEIQENESDRDQYGFRKPKLKQEQRGDLRVNLVPSDLAKRPAAADALQIGKKRRSIMGGNFTYDTQDPHEFTLQQYRDAHQYVYGDGHQMRQARKDSKAVDSVKANHEAKVRIALKQGKKVSSEVLKDYPNLRKAKQPTPDTAKTYAYRDRYLAKKAEKEKAEKTPKHGSAPFKRRKGGALAPIGGQMERTEKNEPKNESKQAEAKEAKLKPQEAIDHKHSSPAPTDAHVDGWLKDTALRVGKPSAANIQKATIEQLGNQHNLQTKGIKTLDAMTSAIHAKMTGSNPKASISDSKAIVDKAHKTRTERANADYKAIQDGDEAAIYRVGRSEALKLPGLASDHRSTIKAHLARTFSKSGGDSKALGLKPGEDFTVAELKNAYRSSSLKAHPDRGGSVEKFHALKESYDRMLPKAKSPALDKVAAETGMTREEVAKAVKRRKAKAEPSAKKAPSEDKPWNRKLTREEIAKKRKENEKLRKTRTDSFFDENSHHSPAF